MEGNRDQYFVRRKLGSPVGPFTEVVLATMLKKGTLDGSEEISVDRRTWRPVRELGRPAAPEVDTSFAPGGTEVLAPAPNGAHHAVSNGEASGGHDFDGGFGSNGRGSTPGGAAAHAALDLGGADAPALELEADDLIPVELAPLGLVKQRGAERDGAAPMAALLSDEDAMSMGHDDAIPGSMPLLPTIRNEPAVDADGERDGGFGNDEALSGEPRPNAAAGPVAIRQRTMSAVRQRPIVEAPAPSAKKKIAIVVAVAAGVGTGSIGLLAFGGSSLFFGEPKAAAILGSLTAEIDRDHFAAYEEGARLLTDAAASRPKSVRLRAAAAELLASSVVIRRGDRTRIHKAEAILADAPTASGPQPELARARGWIALAKGNVKEARRQVADAVAGDPGTALLDGWIDLSDGKAADAAKAFAGAAAAAPAWLAPRYSLGRAQEDAGLAAAAIETQKAVLAQEPSHFGAALAIARAGDFAPSVRRAQAETLIAKASGDKTGSEASRAELADANVLAGRAARLLGKADEADADYRTALALDGGDPVALIAAGERLLEQGKMKEAIARFEVAAPNAPAAPVAVPMKDVRFAMAAVLIEKGNAKQGLGLLDAGSDAAKSGAKGAVDPRAIFWRARAAELMSPPDLAAARQGYEATLKADPRFLPATLQLAALLVQQHKGPEGLAVLRRAEASGAPAAALQIALGQAFLASGDVERATKTFRDALAASPKLAVARLGLSSALEAGGDPTGAKAELETLLAEAPETPGLRQHLAELLVAQGDKDQALATYRAEIATGRATPALRMAAAKLAFDSGHADVARELCEKIVADAPETPGALILLARIRHAAGDLRGAVTELRRALAFESTPELHFEYGRALIETGNPDEAMAELEQAPTLPQAMIERARISIRRGDVERAVAPLEAAVKLAPGSAEGWLLLGNSYDRLGVTPKAEAAWKSAVKADPAAPEAHYRLGRLEMDRGLPGPALAQLRLAAPKIPPDVTWGADFYFQLGFAEREKGTRPGATAALRKYLAIAPADAPSRHEVEQLLGNFGP